MQSLVTGRARSVYASPTACFGENRLETSPQGMCYLYHPCDQVLDININSVPVYGARYTRRSGRSNNIAAYFRYTEV